MWFNAKSNNLGENYVKVNIFISRHLHDKVSEVSRSAKGLAPGMLYLASLATQSATMFCVRWDD